MVEYKSMTKKIIPKLSDLCQAIGKGIGYDSDSVTFTAANCDDVFVYLRKEGVKEIAVDFEEMWIIATFMTANLQQLSALKILTEGTVDKFMGIKLRLIE